MKALRKYKKITGRHDLTVGIWDNCMEIIESNGRRIRVRYHYVHWCNNTGSLAERVVYLERAKGRQVLRRYRRARINGDCIYLSDLV